MQEYSHWHQDGEQILTVLDFPLACMLIHPTVAKNLWLQTPVRLLLGSQMTLINRSDRRHNVNVAQSFIVHVRTTLFAISHGLFAPAGGLAGPDSLATRFGSTKLGTNKMAKDSAQLLYGNQFVYSRPKPKRQGSVIVPLPFQ